MAKFSMNVMNATSVASPDATATDSQKERLKKTLKSSVRRFWKPIKGGKKGTLSTKYGQVEVPKPEGD